MHKHGVTDRNDGLTKIVNHINALAHQLAHAGFGDDAHKTRYSTIRAILGHTFVPSIQSPKSLPQDTPSRSSKLSWKRAYSCEKNSVVLGHQRWVTENMFAIHATYAATIPAGHPFEPVNREIIVTAHDRPFDLICVTDHADHTAPDAIRATTIVTIAASIPTTATRKFAGVVVHQTTY